ncbi:MAG: amidohydrolase, partial [Bacteroidota bacterium]
MARHRLLVSFIVVLFLTFLVFINATEREVELLVVNGLVYTVDQSNSTAEAIAISAGKVVGVGSSSEILKRFKAKDVLDLQGKAVYPGFIDAHVHLLGLGASLMTLNLVGTTSAEQVTRFVGDRVKAAKTGTWIRGRGWDQNDWRVKEFPTHQLLDKVAPNIPVYLIRIDGHASWVNRKVLELAGITKETEDPPGGKIIRDKTGNPTGVLIDAAQGLIAKVVPQPSDEEVEQAIKLAANECLRYGLTSVQDMGVGLKVIEMYKKLIDRGLFPLRNYVAAGGQSGAWEYYLKHGPEMGYGNNHLSVRSVKLVADGALGSRGAALLEPYSDDPGNRGLTLLSSEEISAGAESA